MFCNGLQDLIWLCVLCYVQVLELEQQHSTALQEFSHTYSVEKEQLIEQHKLQLQVCFMFLYPGGNWVRVEVRVKVRHVVVNVRVRG